MANPRCAVCPRTHRPVETQVGMDIPDGANGTNVLVMVIGEGPGQTEVKRDMPFCGKSGIDLNEVYLPELGLSRSEVIVGNVTRCLLPSGNPTVEEAVVCATDRIDVELSHWNPKLVITLGAVAAGVFEPRTDSTLKDQANTVNTKTFGKWTGPVMHCYHPAAALRRPLLIPHIIAGFQAAGEWLDWGSIDAVEDQHPNPDYRLITTVDDFDTMVRDAGYRFGLDTETDEGEPWCWTISVRPGQAGLVMANNSAVADRFNQWAVGRVGLLFNSLFDLDVTDAMGLVYVWEDLLLRAFELGLAGDLGEGGLKPLAKRYMGMRMLDYESVVLPAHYTRMWVWLANVLANLEPTVKSPYTLKSGPRKGQVVYRPSTSATVSQKAAYRAATRILGKPQPKIDTEDPPEWLDVAVELAGPVPRPSIRHVPLAQAIQYACADADATLRFDMVVRDAIRRLENVT